MTGCGFHLRGSFTAPFEKLYIQGGFNNPLIVRLRHMLEAGSNLTIVQNPSEADAILELLSDTRNQDILALNDRGQVREYTAGNKSREQAITDFKQQVADNLDIIVE